MTVVDGKTALTAFVATTAVGAPTVTTTTSTTTTTVAATTTTVLTASGGSIPATGPQNLIGQLLLGAVFLDLGYLALSLLRAPRNRRLA